MSGDLENELVRLRGGRTDSPSNRIMMRIPIRCESASAQQVLTLITDVLKIVLAQGTESDWPELNYWKDLLPRWFIEQCAQEQSPEEAKRWLEWWHSLSPAEQVAAESNAPWSLADWLHWFQPGGDGRQWIWWDGEATTENDLSVVLAAESWPTARGAFDWLVRAAGGVPLEEQPILYGN